MSTRTRTSRDAVAAAAATAAASKKRSNPWHDDHGHDVREDNDNHDSTDDGCESNHHETINRGHGPAMDPDGTFARRSKRLRMVAAVLHPPPLPETRHQNTGGGNKCVQGSTRKSQALQPVNPNHQQQSQRRLVVAKPGPRSTAIVSGSSIAGGGGAEALRRAAAGKSSSTKGRGTASDPLCLFSDEDDDHADDDEQNDEVDDRHRQRHDRQSNSSNNDKRQTCRCHWSSPVPQLHRLGQDETTITVMDRKRVAVELFQPPHRYSDVPAGVTNIDKITMNNPLHAVDYVDDMYKYHRQREVEEATEGGITYLVFGKRNHDKQPHINTKMRAILIDWLIEVHYKFKLFESTLYLTVNIVDRFLDNSHHTSRRDLQLVGVTALLIASKYEELYIPELRDLTYICDDAYTADQILSMEEKILQTIEYKLSVPTARTFHERFCMAATMPSMLTGDQDDIDEEERATQSKLTNLSARVLDGTLLSFKLMKSLEEGGFLPSQLAAASILIARNSLLTTSALDCEDGCDSLKGGTCQCDWTPTLEHYTKYSRNDLLPVARSILDEIVLQKQKQPDLIAVQKKYRHAKYGNVATCSIMEKTMFWDETYGTEERY